MASQARFIAAWMAERKLGIEELLDSSQLDRKVLEAIISGRYTPSPNQRRSLAAALGIEAEEIVWGHVNPVEHVYGHGPQFGRSP
jgi:ribosome-binding protein aMBF1 (putative translation factor)